MPEPIREFERFVRRAHRRWVAWRALERVGLAMLGACALSLPLIALLWFRGQPALGTVAVALAVGASMGAAWGIVHRPTLLDAAMEADRQFNLHDLLGTALTLSRGAAADDAARATVAAAADERCRRLAASRLILNQLGARTWGGIGLAAALVLTLALMTGSPTPTVARADEGARIVPPTTAPPPRRAGQDAPRPPTERRAAPAVSPRSADANALSERAVGDGEPAPARTRTDASNAADGAGSAAGQRAPRAASTPRPVEPRREGPAGSTPAGGDGGATDALTRSPDARAGSGLARLVKPVPATPPWRSSGWDADRTRAMHDVERGAIPEAYRDLVRAYFQEN